MPTIYYIRHGETDWNFQGRLQGVQDVPLNELGCKQSIAAGLILASLLSREGGMRVRSNSSQVRLAARARAWSCCARL
jgi:broad specificity phosphatase PhoE